MKIIFFGTGKFGLPALKNLLKSKHEVIAVVTQPDKKRGRGWNVQPQPMKAFVEKSAPGIKIFQPQKVSDKTFISDLKSADADVFVVVDYGRILTKEILSLPRKYCLNLHPSLLPKYRGASPVNRAIVNGESKTGNAVIIMNEHMDAGDIIMLSQIEIGEREDAVSLLERLSYSGADLLIKGLDKIACGEEEPRKQNEKEATYAPKLRKEEGKIDWRVSACEIDRKVRGMKPWPGAFTYLNGKILKIIEAEVIEWHGKEVSPGMVCCDDKIVVCAGEGALFIKKLQLEGKKAMTSAEFLRGYKFKDNTVLG